EEPEQAAVGLARPAATREGVTGQTVDDGEHDQPQAQDAEPEQRERQAGGDQGKRSINPALADGFVFRKQRQKLVSSSTAAALRNPRRSSPLAGVQGCGAARRKALARWLWQFRSGCRSARWPWHPWACR